MYMLFTVDGPRMKSLAWASHFQQIIAVLCECALFFLRRNPSSRDNLKPIKDPYSVPASFADGSLVLCTQKRCVLTIASFLEISRRVGGCEPPKDMQGGWVWKRAGPPLHTHTCELKTGMFRKAGCRSWVETTSWGLVWEGKKSREGHKRVVWGGAPDFSGWWWLSW